ncbi:MAG: DNA integrity scanning protein DisA nucleotide-binding domain protein [Planctomycetota bacterium]
MPSPRKVSDQLLAFCEMATRMAELHGADTILFLMERPTDWQRLNNALGKHTLLLAADTEEVLAGAEEGDFDTIVLGMPDLPVYERLTEALLEAVAEELLPPGASVVAAYSGFENGVIDSLSLIRLGEHLGRLTVRDLRQLPTKVPTETLKLVVDLAVEIGREGREGKAVGTLFVVGDHRRVLDMSKPMGFDAMRGHTTAERNLADSKVREGIKEVAQMDGAFIVSAKGTVVAASHHIAAPSGEGISLSKGLGARHWTAAQVSHATSAVAIAVSASTGTVRVFHQGEVVLRIEPLRRAMTWKDFEDEPAGDKDKAQREKPPRERPQRERLTRDRTARDKPGR